MRFLLEIFFLFLARKYNLVEITSNIYFNIRCYFHLTVIKWNFRRVFDLFH